MNFILKSMGFIVLALSLYLGWFWQTYNNFVTSSVNVPNKELAFTISSGATLTSVANKLAVQKIISDAKLFLYMIKLDDEEARIQMGEYILKSGMTPRDVMKLFVEGKVKQYPFTIIEGWNFKQMMIAIGSNKKLKQELKDKSDAEIMASIGHAGEHSEGRFLPDTYHFPAGSSDTLFLQRAYLAMEKVLQKEWQNRQIGLPYKTAYEALTMASIIEKETGMATERKQIAGVFVRRLEKRMRLQTDPTVIYGMGDKYKGNLRKKDLKKDTPYNTYRRRGLPPTPIALPGKAAINAALHPLDGKTLYFVAKGDGSHYFSETIKEHNKAVRKYQIRQRKKDYRSTPRISTPTTSIPSIKNKENH